MDSIRRLLGESDDFVPVLVPSTTLLDRQRRARPWFREDPPVGSKDGEEAPTKESLTDDLKLLSSRIRESKASDLIPVADRLDKLVEGINKNAFVDFDAVMTVTTTREPEVVTTARPPEKDPVIAAILSKEPPQSSTQATVAMMAHGTPVNQPQQTPANVQKAMEAAMLGQDAPPKMTLVESSGAAAAASILQTGGTGGPGGPLLGAPPSGDTSKTLQAFARFVKKQ